jgi:hypothetical protein
MAPCPEPVVPAALLGGPAFGLLAGERPSLGPLLPVVLPFNELPVVVELAACPPEAELPPAVAPAPLPGLWQYAAVTQSESAAAKVAVLSFIDGPFICESRTNGEFYLDVPRPMRFLSLTMQSPCANDESKSRRNEQRRARF